MPSAKIRINPEKTEAEFITPEGEAFGGEVNTLVVLGDVTEDTAVYVGVAGAFEGLKPNTIYRISEVRTDLELNALIEDTDTELEIDEDEDEEDEEEDEDETVPVK
jgi:hypothetical protein